MEVAKEKLSNFPSCKTCPTKPTTPWQFFVPFLGWLSDLLERLSDLQLGDKKVTLNHLAKRSFSGHMKNINPKKCNDTLRDQPKTCGDLENGPGGIFQQSLCDRFTRGCLKWNPLCKKKGQQLSNPLKNQLFIPLQFAAVFFLTKLHQPNGCSLIFHGSSCTQRKVIFPSRLIKSQPITEVGTLLVRNGVFSPLVGLFSPKIT